MGLLRIHQSQIVERNGDVRIFIAVSLLIDRERAPIERFGFRVTPLIEAQRGQIAEALGHIGMIGS